MWHLGVLGLGAALILGAGCGGGEPGAGSGGSGEGGEAAGGSEAPGGSGGFGGAGAQGGSGGGDVCEENTADCDGDPANGCETLVRSDPENCGACGASCAGGTCTSGVCDPVLLAAAERPDSVAVHASGVYFPSQDSLLRIPLAGGEPAVLLTAPSSAEEVSNAQIDGERVCFAHGYDDFASVALDGSDLREIHQLGWSGTYLAHGGRLFAATRVDDPYSQSETWTIESAPALGGGTPDVLATGQAEPAGFAAADGWLYWAGARTGLVHRTTTEGGEIATVASDRPGVTDVATDGEHVYWSVGGEPTTGETGRVLRAPAAGGEAQTIAADQLEPELLALRGGAVFWYSAVARAIVAAPKGGGPVAVVMQLSGNGDGTVTGLAVEDGFVYLALSFSSRDGIYRVAVRDGGLAP